jgi:hypothetical protein
LKLVWFKNLSKEEDKEKFKETLKRPSQERQRLLEILSEWYDLVERRGFREEDYSTAGWETLQAFRNGKLAMIREIVELYSTANER